MYLSVCVHVFIYMCACIYDLSVCVHVSTYVSAVCMYLSVCMYLLCTHVSHDVVLISVKLVRIMWDWVHCIDLGSCDPVYLYSLTGQASYS